MNGRRIVQGLAATAALTLSLNAGGMAPEVAADPAAPVWRAAWGTSIQYAAPWNYQASTPAQDFTCRMFARTTLEGDSIKVRLSNAFSNQPLRIGAVSVGLRAPAPPPSGPVTAPPIGGDGITLKGTAWPDLDGGGVHAVTFGATPSPSVVLQPGDVVLSNAVAMPVAAQQDIAVNVWFQGAPVLPQHSYSVVTSYCTNPAGGAQNGSSDQTGTAGSTAFKWSWPFDFSLDAVEVLTTEPGSIVILGDSITDGYRFYRSVGGAALPPYADTYQRGTDFLGALEDSRPIGQRHGVVNEGIGGNRLLDASDPYSGLGRLSRDVLSLDGVTDVVVAEGFNDLHRGRSAADLVAGMEQAITRIHAAGAAAWGVTVTPGLGYAVAVPSVPPAPPDAAGCSQDAGHLQACADQLLLSGWLPQHECNRQEFNGWVRDLPLTIPLATGSKLCAPLASYSGGPRFDRWIDLSKAVGGPVDLMLLPPYNSGDFVHPSALGYREIAMAYAAADQP